VTISGLRPTRSDHGAGGQLPEPPHGRVERGENPDAGDGQAGGGEQHREQAPGEAVVEVVHQTGLAGRGQRRFAHAGLGEDLPVGQIAVQVVVPAVGPCVWLPASRRAWSRVSRTARLDKPRAEGGVGDAEVERLRAQPVGGGEVAGGERGERDGRRTRLPR
jgi:hypothetical protein